MRKIIRFYFAASVFLIWALSVNPAHPQVAQELRFSGSPNPVGAGARALGMGGAFIGVADDATAASWNPGGLIQLETPEVSAVVSWDHRKEDRDLAGTPGAGGSETLDLFDLNYLSAAYPFTLFNRNMIVSLNYQTLYDFNREADADFLYLTTYPGPVGDRSTRRETDGYLKALSPAFAIQATPTLSFGATINWFSEDLGSEWETVYKDRLVGAFGDSPYRHDVWYKEENSFDGLNFNLGMLWNTTPNLTLGAVYKAPFHADVRHKEVYSVDGANPVPKTTVIDEDQTLKMPPSYGVGIAYRFSDLFSMDLDIYRTDWDQFVLVQDGGRRVSLFTGGDRSDTDTDPTHQIRMGGEYLYIHKNKYVIAGRAGLFYDPEPTAHGPDDFFGFSLGTGVAAGPMVVDMAYAFRFGNDVREITLLNETVGQDVRQHTVYLSMIYHF